MLNFPIYVVRKYHRIFTEGKYKIIQTAKTRYVFDYVDYTESNYYSRRVMLLAENLPYKLYPINKRITRIGQVLDSKARLFVDVTGKLINYTPTRFVPVVCKRIIKTWTTPKGYFAIKLEGVTTTFIVDSGGYSYAQVIKTNKGYILFDVLYNKVKNTRKKI